MKTIDLFEEINDDMKIMGGIAAELQICFRDLGKTMGFPGTIEDLETLNQWLISNDKEELTSAQVDNFLEKPEAIIRRAKGITESFVHRIERIRAGRKP